MTKKAIKKIETQHEMSLKKMIEAAGELLDSDLYKAFKPKFLEFERETITLMASYSAKTIQEDHAFLRACLAKLELFRALISYPEKIKAGAMRFKDNANAK